MTRTPTVQTSTNTRRIRARIKEATDRRRPELGLFEAKRQARMEVLPGEIRNCPDYAQFRDLMAAIFEGSL